MSVATNPISDLEEQTALSRRQLAQTLGIDYDDLTRARLGYFKQLPPRIIDGLTAHTGRYPNDIQEQYISWRNSISQYKRNKNNE